MDEPELLSSVGGEKLINADTSEVILQKLKIEHSFYISASQYIWNGTFLKTASVLKHML